MMRKLLSLSTFFNDILKIFNRKTDLFQKYKPDADGFVVIEGKDICPVKKDKYFWEHRHSPEEFRYLLEILQPFFDEVEAGNVPDKYFVNDLNGNLVDAVYVFRHFAKSVEVHWTSNGFECGTNGRHRCEIARKYNLRLLVHIQQYDINNPEE